VFHLQLDTDGVSWSPLDDGVPGSTNAMVVLSRHAGPGDSLLLVRTLMDRDHLRRPRIVLKDVLQWDPLLDVYLNRVPSAFLGSGGEMTQRVGDLASGMGEEDALLIFPEGGNFSEKRRLRAIDRLRGKGMLEQARRAEAMRHVLAPRPGGVAAALEAAPHADVVFVAHTGLEHLSTVVDLWDGLPMDETVRLRWWFVPADEVPRDRRAQEQWLYEKWAEIDAWIASHAPA
jgi:1-acyl-sn-glycerol-3-phosphate acyltransferase